MDLLFVLILINVLLLIIFRLYGIFKVDTFQAIVFNYITCMAVGSIVLGKFPLSAESIQKPWFGYSILLGLLFIGGFNILARTVQTFGVTLSSIAQKMSLILSVGFTIIFYQESVTVLKIIGIIAAIAGIVLINFPQKRIAISEKESKPLWILLILTFLTSGIIDIILYYVEAEDISDNADIGFVVALFGMAALLGSFVLIGGFMLKKFKFEWKNVIAGISLGIPNFFTIYWLLKLINSGLGGSIIFPILNVSIIIGSAVIGLSLFKEKLSKLQWIGFSLGILCIILISMS